jgi:hypothetical protein
VQRAKKLASENNRPLLAPENFHDDRSKNRQPPVLNEKQKDDIVTFVIASRDHRNMQAEQLCREPSLPNVSTSTMQQALYDKGYGRQHPGWKVPLDADAKAQRVAILKQYHPDKFDWRNVVFTDETPAKVGDRRGMERS